MRDHYHQLGVIWYYLIELDAIFGRVVFGLVIIISRIQIFFCAISLIFIIFRFRLISFVYFHSLVENQQTWKFFWSLEILRELNWPNPWFRNISPILPYLYMYLYSENCTQNTTRMFRVVNRCKSNYCFLLSTTRYTSKVMRWPTKYIPNINGRQIVA